MIDFIEYIVSEIKSKRISKLNALSLIKQFSGNLAGTRNGRVIHPLVQINTSDFEQQSFQTILSGQDVFLKDHQVQLKETLENNGTATPILPGVAYLEMARAAFINALPVENEDQVVELKNIVWLQPLLVAEEKTVNIVLYTKEELDINETIEFEIYSNTDEGEILHCQGEAFYSKRRKPARLDVDKLREKMTGQVLSAEKIYHAFSKMGLNYGTTHQGIVSLEKGTNQLLANLHLADLKDSEKQRFMLHPGMLDSALQSSIGFASDLSTIPKNPSLPFALENIQIYSQFSESMLVWVRYSDGYGPDDNVSKLDIDLCDPSGNIAVQLRGFSSRQFASKKENPMIDVNHQNNDSLATILARPVWQELDIEQSIKNSLPEFGQKVVFLSGQEKQSLAQLKTLMPDSLFISLDIDEDLIAESYNVQVLKAFDELKKLASNKESKVLLQLALSDSQYHHLLVGLSGMFKTLSLENPNFISQVVHYRQDISTEELSKKLITARMVSNHQSVSYINEQQQTLSWEEVLDKDKRGRNEATTINNLKENGVYVITGGLGGLGQLFARELLKKLSGVKVILTGREKLSSKAWEKKKHDVFSESEFDTDRVFYEKLNLLDLKSVSLFIEKTISRHRQINGIFHCAGMNSDNFLVKKDSTEVSRVLEPKTVGTYNLDVASKDIELDFLALFSSAVSMSGNLGQADYAAANGFLDQFSVLRNSLVKQKQRKGMTLSINWPLWEDGGMSIDEASRLALRDTVGMVPMKTKSGMIAFNQCLNTGFDQILVMEGDPSMIKKSLFDTPEVAVVIKPEKKEESDDVVTPKLSEKTLLQDEALPEKVKKYLSQELSKLVKIPSHKIDPDASLDNYGIDSILSMNLTRQLEKSFGNLSKTLFFEYQTIAQLAEYFIQSHSEKLVVLLGTSQNNMAATKPAEKKKVKTVVGNQPALKKHQVKRRKRVSIKRQPVNSKLNSVETNEEIAIIGLSGRYPESKDIETYWDNLSNGKDCITEVPESRWDWRDFYSEDRSKVGYHYSKWGGFIEGVDEFDPIFFSISPREAANIDPQERLFLQHSWMAVEDAGYTRNSLQIERKDGLVGQVGVYVGVMYGEYHLSASLASIANRVSYVLNLHGPSMTLDTMCSSSLTAIHLACQDLKLGRTDLGIAGGVNVSINPSKYMMLSAGQFISSDGHCQSFGEGGDGYIPGEGVGAVILKRLSEAEDEGHHIYGVIKGSSLNHGGKTNGYTVPNPQAQANVISQALNESGVLSHHVSYIEAHGTGTKLGDPIEITALTKAFNQNRDLNNKTAKLSCALGSAKSNVGHCESAAGIAGLTKILLQMKYRKIVPSLHSKALNPHIDFDNTPFEVNQTLKDWNTPDVDGNQIPRIAGLSSFGAGGSNAHIILQEYQNRSLNSEIIAPVMIVLSARTPEQLQIKSKQLLEFVIRYQTTLDLNAVAYTLQVGREAMDERLGLMVSDVSQLIDRLTLIVDGVEYIEDCYRGQVKNNKDGISIFTHDEDMKEAIERWIERKKHSKLLDLWVKGLELAWDKLYEGNKPRRISLPTYPFAKEKYWVDSAVSGPLAVRERNRDSSIDASNKVIVHSQSSIHPLLDINTSNFSQQSYHTELQSNQLLTDLKGKVSERLFLSMAFIEMIREAAIQAMPEQNKNSVLRLSNLCWGDIPEIGSKQFLSTELFTSQDDLLCGEIICLNSKNQEELVCYQSEVNFSENSQQERFDLVSMKNRMKLLEKSASISIYSSENQVLSEIFLSETEFSESKKLALNPHVLSHAFNISQYLGANERLNSTPVVKSANSIKVFSACTDKMTLLLSDSSDVVIAEKSFDVALFDQQGNLCVQIDRVILVNSQSKSLPINNGNEEIRTFKLAENSLVQSAADFALPILEKPNAISLIEPENVVITVPDITSKGRVIKLEKSEDLIFSQTNVIESDMAELELIDKASNVEDKTQQEHKSVRVVASNLGDLQQQLKTSLAKALYMQSSDIDLEKSFIDLGLDSIVGVEWVSAINKQYRLEISATRVYDYSNIQSLSEFILDELAKLAPEPDGRIEKPVTPEKKISTETNDKIEQSVEKSSGISSKELQTQLTESLAKALYMNASDIDPERSFVELGLDSIVGVEWVSAINKQYALEISATRVYDYSNIQSLSNFLKEELIEKNPDGGEIEYLAVPETIETDVEMDLENTNHREVRANLMTLDVISQDIPVLKRIPRKPMVENALIQTQVVSNNKSLSVSSENNKIAIIGMSGRYPEAEDLGAYWDNLINGKNSISVIPKSRWDVDQYYDSNPQAEGKIYCKWLGLLDDVDCFDPLFFQISPSEAEFMDPQHRLFMQESYHAFEDAGYAKKQLSHKKCGVYMGIMSSEYSYLLADSQSDTVETTGNSFAIGAARIAYYLNLKGPAIPIDTACSSSLVAVHLGCQALNNHEVDMALAGGVSLYLIAESYQGMCRAGMLSPEGQCKTFDNSADGFVPGEGVGALVLKRLQDAESDNDSIYGVILGSGINQDGKTNGITAPSVNSQIELERDVYSRFKIDPETISYVETHGTGTKLGDPIELEALATVFKEKTSRKNYCALGAVKSNIGHTSGAAGVASIQKVLLSMKHRQLAPSLNVKKENILFDFSRSPFYINKELRDWNVNDGASRRAAISSFGFSGTNAHLVIEEYTPVKQQYSLNINSDIKLEQGIILSAQSENQLKLKVTALLSHLVNLKAQNITPRLVDIAYTLQLGRDAMKVRVGFIANTVEQLVNQLEAFGAGDVNTKHCYQGKISTDKETLAILTQEADFHKTIENWIVERKLTKLLELWVKGLDVDWQLMHQSTRLQRISLPGYPFAKERYWADEKQAKSVSEKATSVLTEQPLIPLEKAQRNHYRAQWKKEVLATGKSNLVKSILLLDSSTKLMKSLKLCLTEESDKVNDERVLILVQYGEAFKQLDNRHFIVRAGKESDFDRVIGILSEQHVLPELVIHSCLNPITDGLEKTINKQLEESFFSLFNLTRSMIKYSTQKALKVVSVYSSSLQHAMPVQMGVGGFCKTLSQEMPEYQSKVIEIDKTNGNEPTMIELANILLAESMSSDWITNDVCYKFDTEQKSERYVRELVSYQTDEYESNELPVKQQGVYLITGGLGGLGYIFSRYLAKEFNAKLVVVGRSELGVKQQQKLSELQKIHQDILYIQADISNLDEMQSAVDSGRKQFSKINGVFHCAGINRDSFIYNKNDDEISSVFSAKIFGTANLQLATEQEELDLFVLFSSGAGVFGNPGQSDYSFANCFIDGFADVSERRRKTGQNSVRTLSINWPYWLDGGMSVAAEVLDEIEQTTGMCALPEVDGLKYWENFVRSPYAQGVALYGYPQRISNYLSGVDSRVNDSNDIADLEVPLAAQYQEYLPEKTNQYLLGLVAQETKISVDRIDPEERFDSFGFDSIMIGRFNANLERDLGALPKTLLYEYQSISELAEYLVGNVKGALQSFFYKGQAPLDEVEKQQSLPAKTIVDDRQLLSKPISQLNELSAVDSESDVVIEKIAIIGVHGHYPQSENLDEYWDNILQGKDLTERVPESRWDCDALYDPDPEKSSEGKIYCQWGGFLEQFDQFDPGFFNISASDAINMDPQERLFLSSVWSVIEDAGYTRDKLTQQFRNENKADVGVFVGVTTNSYHLLAAEESNHGNFINPAAHPWSIANRVSYYFDLKGPSMPVDTACSSSLVAIHLACESLRKRECQLAIAGGVNLYLHSSKYRSFCQRRMLAKEGNNCSFGAGDDGFIPGEGVGSLLLKPLSRAVNEHDHIYAIVAGSGYDHTGRSNVYSAPNPTSQAMLISRVLEESKINPETISYVEGHGTATQLGDSLEVLSLTQAFQKTTGKTNYCPLGSVKANIGHSESAAGIAGVAKILMQLKHQKIAPSIHADTINPDIEFEGSPFYLQRTASDWLEQLNIPRRALINSFGAGGVNASIIIEEFKGGGADEYSEAQEDELFILSAKSVNALGVYVGRMIQFVQSPNNRNLKLSDLCYTLQNGREAMQERLAFVCKDINELIVKLTHYKKIVLSSHETANDVYSATNDPRKMNRKLAEDKIVEVNQLLTNRKLDALAREWVKGTLINWQDLARTNNATRMPLPTYPFENKRYWVTDGLAKSESTDLEKVEPRLHPLVNYNSSTLKDVRFSSLLSADEFYARDHRINSDSIFPGAGFIEMACVCGNIAGEDKVSYIRDIVWLQPLSFSNRSPVVQTVLKTIGDATEYEIISIDESSEAVVHSEGRLFFPKNTSAGIGNIQSVSINQLQQQCNKVIDGDIFYQKFSSLGFDYGTSFRTVKNFHSCDNFAIAQLELAESSYADFEQYMLHPAIIDGALQTVVGLLDNGKEKTAYLPFALDEVAIFKPLSRNCYALVEFSGKQGGHQDDIKKFNIKLVNEQGDVLVQLTDFYVRAIQDDGALLAEADSSYQLQN